AESIEASLQKLGRQDQLSRETFREAERWRDRLVEERSAAATEFAVQTGHPEARLVSLLRELDAAVSEPARRAVRRRIFREVYKVLEKASTNRKGTGEQ